jgi:hypothetical protein
MNKSLNLAELFVPRAALLSPIILPFLARGMESQQLMANKRGRYKYWPLERRRWEFRLV